MSRGERVRALLAVLALIGAGAALWWHFSWHGPTLEGLSGRWRFDAEAFDREAERHPAEMRSSIIALAAAWRDTRIVISSGRLTFERPSGASEMAVEVVTAGEDPPFIAVQSLQPDPPWRAEINLRDGGLLLVTGQLQLPYRRDP